MDFMKSLKMFKAKKGFGNIKNPNGILLAIIIAVVAVSFISATIGLLINATIAISTVPNMPLASLFAAGGAVILLIGAGVVFLYLKFFRSGGK